WKKVALAAVALVVIAGAGYAVWEFGIKGGTPNPVEKTFKLIPPADLKVQPGQAETFTVEIVRLNYDGDVELRFDTPLPVAMPTREVIRQGPSKADVTFKATPDAKPGGNKLQITATGGGLTRDVSINLTIEPAAAEPWLPPNSEPAPGAKRVTDLGKRA